MRLFSQQLKIHLTYNFIWRLAAGIVSGGSFKIYCRHPLMQLFRYSSLLISLGKTSNSCLSAGISWFCSSNIFLTVKSYLLVENACNTPQPILIFFWIFIMLKLKRKKLLMFTVAYQIRVQHSQCIIPSDQTQSINEHRWQKLSECHPQVILDPTVNIFHLTYLFSIVSMNFLPARCHISARIPNSAR